MELTEENPQQGDVPAKKKRKNPFNAETKEDKEKRRLRRARLIIRNISYKTTEEKLRNHFAQFGTITELNLLKRPDGKLVGCAFIQYEKVNDAAKAILKATNKEFLGRPVYVDWAVGKDEFLKRDNKEIKDEPKEEIKEETDLQDESDVKEEDVSTGDDEDIKEESGSENEGSETEDQSGDEDEEDESGSNDDDEDTKSKIKEEQAKPKRKSNDVKEGCTVFIKNLPFDASDQDVGKVCKKFGPIYYSLVNRDKVSGYSKGTAFVKFKTKESADLCLNAGEAFQLMGAVLEPTPALSREDVRNMSDAKNNKEPADNRNLYLVKEGLIMAGSSAADGVSASDMAKRHKLEQVKAQILKNFNRFVSKNRLSIHNLPFAFDDDKLKNLILKSTNLIPHECRVMRENKPSPGHPQGKSKGFGFMSFKTHQDALTALRKLNNNPKIFGSTNRPIVSFSIEDRSVHNIKEKRLKKSRENNPTFKEKLSKLKEKRKLKRLNKKDNKTGINKDVKQKPKNVKRQENKDGDNEPESFVGMPSQPGTFIRMRSNKKIKEQAQVHSKKVSEIKRKQKTRKERIMHRIEKRQIDRTKSRKKQLPQNDNFSILVNKYKKLIDSNSNSSIRKSKKTKWYVE